MDLTKKNKKIESLILGAGLSIRMKGVNKLLKKLNNKTLIEHVVTQSINSKALNTSIIVQDNNSEIRKLLSSLPIKILTSNFKKTELAILFQKESN